MSNLFWLNDAQMAQLDTFFPKSHGKPRVDGRRVLSGIIFINRNGLRWRDAPKEYGRRRPSTTAGNGGATRGASSE
jgi:transposase